MKPLQIRSENNPDTTLTVTGNRTAVCFSFGSSARDGQGVETSLAAGVLGPLLSALRGGADRLSAPFRELQAQPRPLFLSRATFYATPGQHQQLIAIGIGDEAGDRSVCTVLMSQHGLQQMVAFLETMRLRSVAAVEPAHLQFGL